MDCACIWTRYKYVDSRFLILEVGLSHSSQIQKSFPFKFISYTTRVFNVFHFYHVLLLCCRLQPWMLSRVSGFSASSKYTPQGCLTSCGSTPHRCRTWALAWHDTSCAWSSVWWNFESDMQCPSKFRGKQHVCLEPASLAATTRGFIRIFKQIWQNGMKRL